MIILGVDPGSQRTGWGAIDASPRRSRLLECGALCPRPSLALADKLRAIHDGVAELIRRFAPEVLAVEDVFHATNARSALVLGHVRGVVLLAGAEAGIALAAFPPATVKLQVTGSGRADKAQVAFMVARHLALSGETPSGDAADALAVALCQAQVGSSPLARVRA